MIVASSAAILRLLPTRMGLLEWLHLPPSSAFANDPNPIFKLWLIHTFAATVLLLRRHLQYNFYFLFDSFSSTPSFVDCIPRIWHRQTRTYFYMLALDVLALEEQSFRHNSFVLESLHTGGTGSCHGESRV